MLLSSKNSDVGIGASSGENNSCRSNSSEPIMPSVLLNTTSMSTGVTAPDDGSGPWSYSLVVSHLDYTTHTA